jgi:hypothetical protein
MLTIEISEPDARRLYMLLQTTSMFPDVLEELTAALTDYDQAFAKLPHGPSAEDRINAIAAALHLSPGVPVVVGERESMRGKVRRGFFVGVDIPPCYVDGQVVYARIQWPKRDGTPGPTTGQVDIRNLRVVPKP